MSFLDGIHRSHAPIRSALAMGSAPTRAAAAESTRLLSSVARCCRKRATSKKPAAGRSWTASTDQKHTQKHRACGRIGIQRWAEVGGLGRQSAELPQTVLSKVVRTVGPINASGSTWAMEKGVSVFAGFLDALKCVDSQAQAWQLLESAIETQKGPSRWQLMVHCITSSQTQAVCSNPVACPGVKYST